MSLPVLDIGSIGLNVKDEDIKDSQLGEKAEELVQAFSNEGFVYLKNHGIQQEQVKDVHKVAEEFFALPTKVKEKYHNVNQFGWDRTEEERLNLDRPADLKENFNIIPRHANKWPEDEVPDFKEASLKFFQSCHLLCKRLFMALAIGLGIEDKHFFTSRHNPHIKPNGTCIRMLHYPPVPNEVKAGQIRLGEHTDYGCITLLFQGSVGGLEVMSKDGTWTDAPPIPGAILVNIADLLQYWTSNKLRSTVHRVRIPEDEIILRKSRYSVVCFVHPDTNVEIRPLDGSESFPAFTAGEYLAKRFTDTYAERPFNASSFK